MGNLQSRILMIHLLNIYFIIYLKLLFIKISQNHLIFLAELIIDFFYLDWSWLKLNILLMVFILIELRRVNAFLKLKHSLIFMFIIFFFDILLLLIIIFLIGLSLFFKFNKLFILIFILFDFLIIYFIFKKYFFLIYSLILKLRYLDILFELLAFILSMSLKLLNKKFIDIFNVLA